MCAGMITNAIVQSCIFWWQGDKDRYNAGHAAMYEKNLNNLIAALRKDFNAP